MRPEDVRGEIRRLEDRRLRSAPEVMGGDREAFEEDRRLERRIMELAGTGREGTNDGRTVRGSDGPAREVRNER